MTLYSINMTIPMVIISEPSNIIINKIIDLLPSITLITGGLWGVYKYIQEKNRNFYLNILENVYGPLFEELVIMEYMRKHLINAEKDQFEVDKAPFIQLGKTEKTKKDEDLETLIYDLDNKIKEVIKNSNLAYAPKDLVVLLKAYMFLDEIKYMPKFNYEEEKDKIQKAIRRNVIMGYSKYRKKLGLQDISLFYNFCTIKKGNIKFK